MTNWTLIGPATGVLQAKVNVTGSTSELTVNKSTDAGAWIEYSASWPETTNRLRITTRDGSHSTREGGVSIGIGPPTEREILEFPRPDYGGAAGRILTVPITIRAGERVSIRPESAASVDVVVSLSGWMDPLFRTDLRYSDIMGKVSKSSLTNPDPLGVADTKGGWLELIDPTLNDYKGIVVVFGNHNVNDTTSINLLYDLGIGELGSEVVIIPDMWIQTASKYVRTESNSRYFDIHIPAGVRLSARCASNNIVVGVRDMTGIAVIGLY